MTAGVSLGEMNNVGSEMWQPIYDMLDVRLKQTV